MLEKWVVAHRVKARILSGTSYSEVNHQARILYRDIERRTKRKPYVRSVYFKKDKIFFDLFWSHLHQKNPRDRMRRLRYFPVAVELIKKSRQKPVSEVNRHRLTEILHRFTGVTSDGHVFYVNIKENTRSHRKYFMSCFD